MFDFWAVFDLDPYDHRKQLYIELGFLIWP